MSLVKSLNSALFTIQYENSVKPPGAIYRWLDLWETPASQKKSR